MMTKKRNSGYKPRNNRNHDNYPNCNDPNESNAQPQPGQNIKPNSKYKRKNPNQSLRYYSNSFYTDDSNPSSFYHKRRKEDNNLMTNEGHQNKRKNFFKRKSKSESKIPLETLPPFRGTRKYDKNIRGNSASRVSRIGRNKKKDNFNNLDRGDELLKAPSSTTLGESSFVKNDKEKEVIGSAAHCSSLFTKNPSQLLKWLLHPVDLTDFHRSYWEKSPLVICRDNTDYYNDLNVTTATLDGLLKDNHVLFGKNIDITTYSDGVRETHNPVGRANAHIVWDFFKNGCSVRLLNPQTFINSIYRLNEILQNYFNGFVGANMYLTPPNSQGFAPHFDDIEAFVIQLEGTKYWKVYKPRKTNELLPRYSSPNFTEEEVGEPILEIALRPGDLLYFPRGFIHQASTRDELSLHVTLSAYQCNAYVDLFEKLLPDALRRVSNSDVEFRRGLPLDLSSHFGLAVARSKKKEIMKQKIETMVQKVLNNLDIDSAVDSFFAKRLHDQLPPYFTEGEKNSMVFDNRTKLSEDGKTVDMVQLELSSRVKLINPKLCRLVKGEDNKYLLYHSVNNSMEYHGYDEEFLEVPEDSVPAFQRLCNIYPHYIRIKKLPIKDDEAKWSFANSLWEIGLLRTEKPLNSIKTDFSGHFEETVEAEGSESSDYDDCEDSDDNKEEEEVEKEEEEEEEEKENENENEEKDVDGGKNKIECESATKRTVTVDHCSVNGNLASNTKEHLISGAKEDTYIDVCGDDSSGSEKIVADNNGDDVIIVE